MSDLILYSFIRCPFAIRVRMTLEEKGLNYQVKEENLKAKSAELLRLHPEGRVPLLLHKGDVIYESSVITEYLDSIFADPPLRPSSPLAQAQIRLWTRWCDITLKPDIDLYKYKWDKLNDDEKSELAARIRAHLKKTEDALNSKPYLMGEDFSLADIHVFPFMRQIEKAKPDFRKTFDFPKTFDWLDRLLTRPSFIRAMKKTT